ncbi:packaged DNA stabilization protein [Sphingomonas albertensis]|uniref:packaged DNA stabilization protein n=1 Tax=Sphingomonas albertensis TaxID=2762591 RepID=UPI0037DA0710
MVQVPILSGIYAKTTADFARSFPVNLAPIAESGDGTGTGISKGYLKVAPGLRKVTSTVAIDRGGYVFNGRHMRVIGPMLYQVADDGVMTLVGSVGALGQGKPVTFAQSFDRLGIASDGALWYYKDDALTKVTDPDLGPVLSMAWQDGYFITTDGTSLIVTELNDPTSVDPLKYGSSEADPDPVTGILSLRGQVYALNRYTIEVFINGGTTGFPFARSRGGQIPKGCVGSAAFTPFVETFAFCGSGRNESPAIYLAGAGQGIRISPRGLDDALALLPEDKLAAVELEARNGAGMTELLVHLPNETWVYHWTASQQFDLPVWSRLAGGADVSSAYPARHFVFYGNEWWCGGADAIGVLDEQEPTFFGKSYGFQFDTPLVYNGRAGAIVHDLELVTLAGRVALEAFVDMSYTDDGVTWSQKRTASLGGVGDRDKRPCWRRGGRIRRWRGYRFSGLVSGPAAFARLEAQLEPLNG